MVFQRKIILCLLIVLGCGASSLQLMKRKELVNRPSSLDKKTKNTDSRYVFSTLSNWTASVFSGFQEYALPGTYKKEKEHEEFLKNLKSDLEKVLQDFIALSQSDLCNQDLWLNKTDAFDKNDDLFDYKKDPGLSYQHPFVEKQNIPVNSQVCFIGDIHGSIHSLLRILCYLSGSGKLNNDFSIKEDNFYIVFNGDFTDRGRYGCEVWYAILRLKLANPDKVFLVRGNHEDCDINKQTHIGAFDKEVEVKLGKNYFHYFQRVYELLPMAVYLECNNNTIQCCHGGIETGYDPRLFLKSKKQFDAIAGEIDESTKKIEKDFFGNFFNKKNNYSGFNWSDFYQNIPDQVVNYCKKLRPSRYSNAKRAQKKLVKELKSSKDSFPYHYCLDHVSFNSLRGCGYIADAYATLVYLKTYSLKGIFRGHQDMGCGLKMLFDPKKQTDIFDDAEKVKDKKLKPDVLGKICQDNVLYQNGPYHWVNVVSSDDAINEKGFLLKDYLPIFTFTTATEARGLPHDCFGILVVTDDYDTWRLKPYELTLSNNRNGKFVEIKKHSKKENFFFFDHDEQVMSYKELFDCIKGFCTS